MRGEHSMSTYQKGDHVKIEVVNEQSAESEWMWLLVDHSDDEQRLVFVQLNSEPMVATDMKRGQVFAVSYRQAHDHRKLSDFQAP
jgi:hypothetical protein